MTYVKQLSSAGTSIQDITAEGDALKVVVHGEPQDFAVHIDPNSNVNAVTFTVEHVPQVPAPAEYPYSALAEGLTLKAGRTRFSLPMDAGGFAYINGHIGTTQVFDPTGALIPTTGTEITLTNTISGTYIVEIDVPTEQFVSSATVMIARPTRPGMHPLPNQINVFLLRDLRAGQTITLSTNGPQGGADFYVLPDTDLSNMLSGTNGKYLIPANGHYIVQATLLTSWSNPTLTISVSE